MRDEREETRETRRDTNEERRERRDEIRDERRERRDERREEMDATRYERQEWQHGRCAKNAPWSALSRFGRPGGVEMSASRPRYSCKPARKGR